MPFTKLRSIGAFALLIITAIPVAAALSPRYQEWRQGPAQWIMTPEEQKTWKQLKTDEEASQFVDLFWARRDPTPGTTRNEYKDDFAAHVKYADENYKEPRKRGALTDRGRTLIALGLPSNAGKSLAGSGRHTLDQDLTGNGEASRLKGAREVWLWEHDDAVAKFGMPKVEVVFVQDPVSGKFQRDPLRSDFMSALPVAIKRSIISPDMTEVPAWAPRGGLDPQVLAVTERTSEGEKTVAIIGAGSIVTTAPAVSSSPSAVSESASRLTLVRDIYILQPQSKVDPWTKMTPLATFTSGADLGWVAQYCTGSDDEPTLRYSLRIASTTSKRIADRVAPPDEIVPDRLKSAPGCYMLRGSVPLEGMDKGTYRFEVAVENPTTGASSQLSQEFTIE